MIRPPLSVEAAQRVTSRLHLRDVICMGLKAERAATGAEVPEDARLGWRLKPIVAICKTEGGSVVVLLPLDVVLFARVGDEPPIPLADISVALRIEYSVSEGEALDELDVQHHAGTATYLHAWPYFRADVQMLSTKLGFSPLVLPTIMVGVPASNVTVQTLDEARKKAKRSPKARKKQPAALAQPDPEDPAHE